MQWRDLETFTFGDGPKLAEWLATLVLDGRKTATSWAASDGMLTEVGKVMVMLDGAGTPQAVIETMELTECRFDEVDELFAFEEGEGDRTLSYWREAHRRYFTRRGQFRGYDAVVRALSGRRAHYGPRLNDGGPPGVDV
jgi:uncharacterized protein YhfF